MKINVNSTIFQKYGIENDGTIDICLLHRRCSNGSVEELGKEHCQLLSLKERDETLESYYPGLADLATEQLVAKAPMMSSVVNEIVLAQCATEEDAAAAAAILQDRVDAQAEGGAWYPESMEAWSNAQVIQEGSYVAMIASSQYQDELAASFQEQFA